MQPCRSQSTDHFVNLPRTIHSTLPEGRLPALLASGKKLRVKYGIDPTSPHIHIGNAIGLLNARWFQRQGHKVIIVIGQATAEIGDPSGRDKTRPMLDAEVIKANAQAWISKLGSVLDTDPNLLEVVWNNEHFEDLPPFMRFVSRFTVQQMLERDSFQLRLRGHEPIALHELLYPLMQGFDSVKTEADIELGGTDQLFNIGIGRRMQEIWYEGMDASLQVGVFHELLPGTDGNAKMSKSLGNAIAIDSHPTEMFGKAMSIPDTITAAYMRLATDLTDEEIALEESNRDKKLRMAHALVKRWHGIWAADTAKDEFIRVFSEGGAPDNVPLHGVTPGKWKIADLLMQIGLATSKSEGRRKILEKAVEIGGHPVTPVKDAEVMVVQGGEQLVRLGRRFARIVGQ